MFPELRFSESEIRRMIDSATPEAVLNSLAKEKRNYFDLLNLISPAAMECLPQMREVSRKCRLRYYGKTVTIYAPLYGDSVVCFWKPQAHYQGWIDTLHGGIQATLIDECASWVMFRRLQTTGVTTKLEVRYRKSIMTTEEQITIRATLREMRRNLALIHVEIANSKGELCTEGEATYFTFPPEKAREMGFTSCDADGDGVTAE